MWSRQGKRERNGQRMKVAKPSDQETRDKEGPVCSVQHQTEPVAPFVPPKKLFHHKAHSLILLLLLFPHPPNSFPTSKRNRLTSDLHDSSSMSFKIKHQVFSFPLQLFSFILFLFPPSHMPVQRQRGRDLSIITTREHTGGLGNRHRRWGDVCVYSSSLLRTWTTDKKPVHATCWLKGVKLGIDYNQLFHLWGTNKNQSIMTDVRAKNRTGPKEEDKPQHGKQFVVFLCNLKISTWLGYLWLRLKNRFSRGISFQDACIPAQTQNEIQHTHTHTRARASWAAKEGFILRVLESDISMALSRVSMAIPCTEIIRGDPRLRHGIQQGQIYISSRVDRPLPLLFPPPFLRYHNGPWGPPCSTTLLKAVLIPHFWCFFTQPCLTVTHRASFSVKMVWLL